MQQIKMILIYRAVYVFSENVLCVVGGACIASLMAAPPVLQVTGHGLN